MVKNKDAFFQLYLWRQGMGIQKANKNFVIYLSNEYNEKKANRFDIV